MHYHAQLILHHFWSLNSGLQAYTAATLLAESSSLPVAMTVTTEQWFFEGFRHYKDGRRPDGHSGI